jgi:hypothetical protein
MYKPDFEIERHKREQSYQRVDVVMMLLGVYVLGYITALLVNGL